MQENEDLGAPVVSPTPEPPVERSTVVARLGAWMERSFPGLGAELARIDVRVTVIMVVASVALVVFKKLGSGGTFQSDIAWGALKTHPRITVMSDYYWFLSCFVLLGLVPLATLRITARRPLGLEEIGLGVGDWRTGLRWGAALFAVMFAVVVIVSRGEAFSRYYPMNEQLGTQAVAAFRGDAPEGFWPWFIGYELLYVVYFLGWEYFFRGFLQFALWDRWRLDVLLVANIPFVLMRSGKPLAEALGAVLAGFALGLFAWRTRSFWYCWALHAAIAVSMDLCAIERRLELVGAK